MATEKELNNEKANESNEKKLTLGEIFKYFKKKWIWFCASVIIFLGLGFLYSMIKAPVYEIDANIRISQDESSGLLSIAGFTDLFGGGNNVDDEVFVVQSHSVLREVVEQNKFYIDHWVKTGFGRKQLKYDDYPIEVTLPAGIQDTLTTGLTFRIKAEGNKINELRFIVKNDDILEVKDIALPATIETDYGKFIFTPTEYYPEDDKVSTNIFVSGVDAKAEEISSGLEISVANRQSNVITLCYKSTSIAYAKALINSIIDQYNKRAIADKTSQASQTLQFIDQRLGIITEALASAEDDVADFKNANGLVDIYSETGYNYTKRGEIETELISAGTSLEIMKMTRDFLRTPGNEFELLPTASSHPALQPLFTQYNELILQYMDLSRSAKGNNTNLRDTEEKIRALRENVLKSIDRLYTNLQAQYNSLNQQNEATKSRLAEVPGQERQIRDILRQQKIKEQLYIFLLQRREETAMMMANALPKGIIIDEAYALTKPVGLSRNMLLAFCFILGLVMPAFFFYIRLLTLDKFSTREELERHTDIPILGEICQSKRDEKLVVYNGGSSSISELFRLIRTNLQFMLTSADKRVILTTSTRSGEGKSFVAINLAASFALMGRKTLLVGMDIRKPMLEEYLGMSHNRGLTDYLSSEAVDIDDIIRKHPLDNSAMDIITAGPVPPNPAELLLSERLDDLFRQLRARYDYIIIDSAPVGMVSDTYTLDRLSDATIYICRANYTSIKDIQYINKAHSDKRLHNLAIVLNGTAMRKGYGYGYGNKTDNEE